MCFLVRIDLQLIFCVTFIRLFINIVRCLNVVIVIINVLHPQIWLAGRDQWRSN